MKLAKYRGNTGSVSPHFPSYVRPFLERERDLALVTAETISHLLGKGGKKQEVKER
ncbi:MAG: hypothetical protein HZA10_02130 [Nitrospirae bacterium]|nr:hypothetical protein [Nitrospirota bacterium]